MRISTFTCTRSSSIKPTLPALLFGACLLLGTTYQDNGDPDGLYAHVYTPKGEFVIRLDMDRTPMTAANMVGLAEGTIANAAFPIGRPFFDGSSFPRVVPGHVIQGGAPASEQSRGSGYRLPNEIHEGLSHDHAGSVGMANGGPHTADNQFYVTLGDRSYLDGDYTVFGDVTEGMEVVQAIGADDGIDSIRIVRVGEVAERFRPTTESFGRMVDQVKAQNEQRAADHEAEDEAYVNSRWSDLSETESGLEYLVDREGDGPVAATGEVIVLRYRGQRVRAEEFASDATGNPDLARGTDDRGRSFSYSVGSDGLPPGLAEAVGVMRPGEIRTVIVPAELGYGVGGYYRPEEPGKPRFHISPNTMLVYVVERVAADHHLPMTKTG